MNNADIPEDETKLKEAAAALELLHRQTASREHYSKIRTEREKATFAMMMRMNPEALTNIRKEFFVREDEITLDEFIYIIQKHLNKSTSFEGEDQREFGMKMFELFKDIDVNGDGNLEWQEFTTYVVEKANILNKRLKSTSIPHYYDSSETLDASAQYRHRHDISKFVKIPNLCQFAMVEDHKNSIFVFNSRLGKNVATIAVESAPVALEYVVERDILVASCADMTLATYSVADPNPNRRYRQKSAWSTPGVQMALAYMPANTLLYSGGTNGNLYSWNINNRSLISTFTGHSDIVMSLTILQKLNNVASGSLDKTINVWDSYTNARVLELHGHKKGVLDMTYNPEYRLLFSCGFEHDACVWSPFVNSLVYRFRGHHASLVGIQAVEDTPEVITADISGVFKLWDIRNYQCVQTFTANLTGSDTKDSSKLSCFFQTRLPPVNNQQKDDDSRIYAASKMIFSFDQARVVHDATTDFTSVSWVGWNEETSNFITVSENTVIVWDALIGSKTVTNLNICNDEISASCLDDRRRKIVIGDVHGRIGVYNCTNGAIMKTVQNVVPYTVVVLEYIDESRRFIAGYSNGAIRLYDENSLEDCNLVRSFDSFNSHPELICLSYNPGDNTVATAGASSGVVRLWDFMAGKCEIELKVCDATECLVNVIYLKPYPFIATADSKGNVCIWGSRGSRWPGKRIGAFMNQTTTTAITERSVHFTPDGEEAPRRVMPPSINRSRPSSAAPQLAAQRTFSAALSNDDDNDSDATNQSPAGSPGARNKDKDDDSLESSCKSQSQDSESGYGPVSPGDYSKVKEIERKREEKRILTETASEKEAREYFRTSEELWGRAMPAQCMAFEPASMKLFTADDLGYLRCFSLEYMLNDVGGASMLRGPNARLKDTCQHKARDDFSAPPPIFKKSKPFLVGKKGNAMSFLGVEFCWTITAHHDRVIYCMTTTDGIVTSAADRLVKMWTFDGLPIGVLLQSVPVGTRSRSWNLELDAEGRMAQEGLVLDGIISDVITLCNRPDIPDIDTADLTGIDPGSDAADFSRSELRQRIEMTSEILGIDFPTESELARRRTEGLLDDEADSDLNSTGTNSKSLKMALKELKSPTAAVDYEAKAKTMTILQRRRKATKMEAMSSLYEGKAGMKVSASSHKISGMEDIDMTSTADNASVTSTKSGLSKHKESTSLGPQPLLTDRSKQSKLHSARESKPRQGGSGPRAQSMQQLCTKYTSYDALDKAICGISTDDQPEFSEEERKLHNKETSRIKEFHQSLIRRMSTVRGSHNVGHGVGGGGAAKATAAHAGKSPSSAIFSDRIQVDRVGTGDSSMSKSGPQRDGSGNDFVGAAEEGANGGGPDLKRQQTLDISIPEGCVEEDGAAGSNDQDGDAVVNDQVSVNSNDGDSLPAFKGD